MSARRKGQPTPRQSVFPAVRWTSAVLALAVFAAPLEAGEISLEGTPVQGGLIVGTVVPGAEVLFAGQPVRVSPTGLFVVGFGRDDTGEFELVARFADGSVAERRLSVAAREYAIERIDGLPPKTVTSEAADVERIRRENARIAEVRARDTDATWFADGFSWPVQGRVSGVYGSQRILNGEPRRPHYGVDIAAALATPVLAPAPGVVAMAEDDLYYTGGTVMLDHGHGLTSIFSHLDSVGVSFADFVENGQVIGTVGASGRATGPHLDWRVNLFKTRLDPALLAGPMKGR